MLTGTSEPKGQHAGEFCGICFLPPFPDLEPKKQAA